MDDREWGESELWSSSKVSSCCASKCNENHQLHHVTSLICIENKLSALSNTIALNNVLNNVEHFFLFCCDSIVYDKITFKYSVSLEILFESAMRISVLCELAWKISQIHATWMPHSPTHHHWLAIFSNAAISLRPTMKRPNSANYCRPYDRYDVIICFYAWKQLIQVTNTKYVVFIFILIAFGYMARIHGCFSRNYEAILREIVRNYTEPINYLSISFRVRSILARYFRAYSEVLDRSSTWPKSIVTRSCLCHSIEGNDMFLPSEWMHGPLTPEQFLLFMNIVWNYYSEAQNSSDQIGLPLFATRTTSGLSIISVWLCASIKWIFKLDTFANVFEHKQHLQPLTGARANDASSHIYDEILSHKSHICAKIGNNHLIQLIEAFVRTLFAIRTTFSSLSLVGIASA